MSSETYHTDQYDYFLPEELIAQAPAEPRDTSRLMVLDRDSGNLQHKNFREIINYFQQGDILVLNNTKVIPARLSGIKGSGTAKVELLLLRPLDDQKKNWEALVRPGKKLKPGSFVELNDGTRVDIGDRSEGGTRLISFSQETDVPGLLSRTGQVPLPPYISNRNIRASEYQTVFASREGSAAAPTASLHFSEDILEEIAKIGVKIAWVTLHVGLGTFRPVKVNDIREHQIHDEYCEIPDETARVLNENRGRVIAAGTTVVRTLESMTDNHGITRAGGEMTRLFIYPGYSFKKVDLMLTNFHLPKSTLLMLVSAFAGKEHVMNAYDQAVKRNYRFFSFGDAMLII